MDPVRGVDAALVRSAHDPEAFVDVVRSLGPALHAYLVRRAPDDADDLLADTWLRAYSARATFDPARGTARAWAFGVARHSLHAHWRRTYAAPTAPSTGEAVEDPWPAVDDRLAAAAAAPALREALRDLPDAELELLLLVAWDGLTPTESAAVVGIPAATARTRLFRARTRLRERLAENTQEDGVSATAGATGGDPR